MHDFWKKEAQFKALFVRRELVELMQDLVVGVLLSQIVYWFKPSKEGKLKVTVEREGKLWIAKDRQQWKSECLLTEDQYRRAIEVLQRLQLIAVKRFGFAGKIVTHIWLDLDVLDAMMWGHQASSLLTNGDHPDSEAPLIGEKNQSNKESKLKESKGIETPQAATAQDKTNMAEASEILQGFKDKKIDPSQVKASTGSVALLWKKRMATLYPKHAKMILPPKEMGLIKTLVKEYEKDAPVAIDWVVQNWGKFCAQCSQVKGLSNTPSVPDLLFLTLHRHVLKVMMPFPPPTPLQPQVPLQSIAASPIASVETPVLESKPQDDDDAPIDVAAELAHFAAIAKGKKG